MPARSFWKNASATIESLLNNPVKYNHNDLLIQLPEDENLYKVIPSISPLHLKTSSLDTSYKTYNPKIMGLIEKAKQFECIADERKLMRTPKIMYKTGNFGGFLESKEDFSVSGRKAKILLSLPDKTPKMPNLLNLNTKLKEFIGKVQDKYLNLVKALEFKNDVLSFDAVVEYLKKSSILLKRPTYTRDRQRVYSNSPSMMKRSDRFKYEENCPSSVSEKIVLLNVRLI